MENRQIRNRALDIYKQNIAVMLLAGGIFMMPAMYSSIFGETHIWTWQYFAKICWDILVYPLSLGCAAYFLAWVKGEKPTVSRIFICYFDSKLLVKALLLRIILKVVDLLFAVINELIPAVGSQTVSAILSLIVSVVFVYIQSFRFFLVPYVFMRQPEMNLLSVLATSFRKMKGYSLKLFFLLVSVMWIPLFVLFLILLLLLLLPSGGAIISPFNLYSGVIWICWIVIFPVAPFRHLCDAGLAAELLREKRKLRVLKAADFTKGGRKYRYKVDWEEFEN